MRSSVIRPSRLFLAACIAVVALSATEAADKRTQPIDAYLLIDRSTAMGTSGPAAADWLCTAVVENLLQTGDRVTVWAFAERPQRIMETTLSDAASKESLKKAIRAVGTAGAAANYAEALREAAEAEAARPDRNPIAFVLLTSALRQEPIDQGALETAALLRFSRIEDHPGWKAVTLGLGLTDRVRAAAAAFIENFAEAENVRSSGKMN